MARKSYSKKRQIIDVQDFGEIDFDEEILICVPKFAWTVARSWLSLQGKWDTTYAREYFANGYDAPDAEEMDVIHANLAEFLEATDMSCDLDQALEDVGGILQALVDKDCCAGGGTAGACTEGSGGAGPGEAPPETFEDDGETTFPEFFGDRDEYLDKKCGIARDIVARMLADLVWMKALAVGELLVASFVAALLSPVPGDEVVALVALLLGLALNGLMVAALEAIEDAINDRIESLVCLMMQAATVQDAEDDFETELGLSGTDAVIAALLIGHDSFNDLFNFGLLPGGYQPCLCESCLCGLVLERGTSSDGIHFDSEFDGSWHVVKIWINMLIDTDVCENECGDERMMEVVTIDGWTPRTPASSSYQVNSYEPVCDTPVNVWNSEDTWSNEVAGRSFYIGSATAFSVEINC